MSNTTSALNEVETFFGGNEQFSISELAGLAIANVRGGPQLAQAVKKALDITLPQDANTVTESNGWSACWAGPDEWILLSDAPLEASSQWMKIESALTKSHFALTDQSSAFVVLRLSGSKVRDVLQRGTTFDVHPREFQQDQCAQTGLEKMPILMIARQNDDKYSIIDVIVRRSFADYCVRWLDDAAFEFK